MAAEAREPLSQDPKCQPEASMTCRGLTVPRLVRSQKSRVAGEEFHPLLPGLDRMISATPQQPNTDQLVCVGYPKKNKKKIERYAQREIQISRNV